MVVFKSSSDIPKKQSIVRSIENTWDKSLECSNDGTFHRVSNYTIECSTSFKKNLFGPLKLISFPTLKLGRQLNRPIR